MNEPEPLPEDTDTVPDSAQSTSVEPPSDELPPSPTDRSEPPVPSDSAGHESVESPPGAPEPKTPSIKDVRTIDGLLRYAYGRSGRFTIPPKVRDAITDDETLIVDLRAEIQDLASQDPLLKVPVRVLAAVDRAKGSLKFRRRCLSAVALGLLSNPALRGVTDLDLALLDDRSGEPSELLDKVAQHLPTFEPVSSPEEDRWKDSDRRDLTENGILAVAYYFALQRDWTDATLAKHLQPVLWATSHEAAKTSKRESTRALLTEAPPAALGTVSSAWRKETEEADDRSRSADRLRAMAEEERDEARQSQGEAKAVAERLQARLVLLDRQIEDLQQAVAEEQQKRHVQSSHAVDDYESLRTRVLRSIDRQLTLLEDGLHALRNGSTSVTEEYLERVIEAFVNQTASLRQENSSEESTP